MTSKLPVAAASRVGYGIVVLLAAGAALAGCGGAASSGASAATSSAATSSAGSSPDGSGTVSPASSAATPGPGGSLVTFERQGGLAGLDDMLTIRPDGSYVLAHRDGAAKNGRLSPADLATLRRVLDAARLSDLPPASPGPTVADGFTYRLTYGGHEVRAADGAVPAPLTPVLAALADIAGRTG